MQTIVASLQCMFLSVNFNEIIPDTFGPDYMHALLHDPTLNKSGAILFAQVVPPDYLLITFLILIA